MTNQTSSLVFRAAILVTAVVTACLSAKRADSGEPYGREAARAEILKLRQCLKDPVLADRAGLDSLGRDLPFDRFAVEDRIEMQKIFRRLARKYPDRPAVLWACGRFWAIGGYDADARKLLRRLLELPARDPGARAMRDKAVAQLARYRLREGRAALDPEKAREAAATLWGHIALTVAESGGQTAPATVPDSLELFLDAGGEPAVDVVLTYVRALYLSRPYKSWKPEQAELFRDALRRALTCARGCARAEPEDPWVRLYEGFFLALNGYEEEARESFIQGIAGLPPGSAERACLEDPGQVSGFRGAPQGRILRYWIYLMMAEIQYGGWVQPGAADPTRGWETPLGADLVRRGPPDLVVSNTAQFADSLQTGMEAPMQTGMLPGMSGRPQGVLDFTPRTVTVVRGDRVEQYQDYSMGDRQTGNVVRGINRLSIQDVRTKSPAEVFSLLEQEVEQATGVSYRRGGEKREEEAYLCLYAATLRSREPGAGPETRVTLGLVPPAIEGREWWKGKRLHLSARSRDDDTEVVLFTSELDPEESGPGAEVAKSEVEVGPAESFLVLQSSTRALSPGAYAFESWMDGGDLDAPVAFNAQIQWIRDIEGGDLNISDVQLLLPRPDGVPVPNPLARVAAGKNASLSFQYDIYNLTGEGTEGARAQTAYAILRTPWYQEVAVPRIEEMRRDGREPLLRDLAEKSLLPGVLEKGRNYEEVEILPMTRLRDRETITPFRTESVRMNVEGLGPGQYTLLVQVTDPQASDERSVLGAVHFTVTRPEEFLSIAPDLSRGRGTGASLR